MAISSNDDEHYVFKIKSNNIEKYLDNYITLVNEKLSYNPWDILFYFSETTTNVPPPLIFPRMLT